VDTELAELSVSISEPGCLATLLPFAAVLLVAASLSVERPFAERPPEWWLLPEIF
jgi:hypothetical protein